MSSLLEVHAVTAGYGDSVVLEEVSLSVAPGARLAVLGRNGAGKTTLLATLLGFAKIHRGSIRWQGADLAGVPTFKRARAGIGWVPQERCTFPSLTVDEHLRAMARPGPWDASRVYRAFPRLEERRAHMGDELSGGEQQILALARALTTNPRLLLLDEPLEGLAPATAAFVTNVVRGLQGTAIILVEQRARLALSVTDDAIVLERGTIAHRSSSRELLEDADTLHRLLTLA